MNMEEFTEELCRSPHIWHRHWLMHEAFDVLGQLRFRARESLHEGMTARQIDARTRLRLRIEELEIAVAEFVDLEFDGPEKKRSMAYTAVARERLAEIIADQESMQGLMPRTVNVNEEQT